MRAANSAYCGPLLGVAEPAAQLQHVPVDLRPGARERAEARRVTRLRDDGVDDRQQPRADQLAAVPLVHAEQPVLGVLAGAEQELVMIDYRPAGPSRR